MASFKISSPNHSAKKARLMHKALHYWYMGLLGFFSALPLTCIMSTLGFFGKENGFSAHDMATLSVMTFPYALKVVFIIVIRQWCGSSWMQRIGHHRFFSIVAQTIMGVLFYVGPYGSMTFVLLWVTSMALCSTVLDSMLETYRIESTSYDDQSVASGYNALGWRVGSLFVSYVPLVIAHYKGWQVAFYGLSILSFVGSITMGALTPVACYTQQKRVGTVTSDVKETVGFLMAHTCTTSVVAMIFAFKMGDVFLKNMVGRYFMDVGLNLRAIAQMDKGIGAMTTLLGLGIAGVWMHKKTVKHGFYAWVIVKAITIVLFWIHSICFFVLGKPLGLSFLWVADMVMHFAGGIGTTAFMTYLACVAKPSGPSIMVCFGLLSSLGALGRTVSSACSGYVLGVVHESWPWFFMVSMVSLFPVVWVMWRMRPFAMRITDDAHPLR